MSKRVFFVEPDVNTEICGFELSFEEVRIRGKKKKICRVSVREVGSDDVTVMEQFDFKSWTHLLTEYPKPIDFLKYLAQMPAWDSRWRDYDRAYYISSSEGHNGLYKLKKPVCFDAREEFKGE